MTEMQITYVDPERRALFVAEQPGGGFGVFTQRDKAAPRKLTAPNYFDRDGYATRKEAQNALDLYVANKRDGSARCKWEVYANGKSITFEQKAAIIRGEMPAPEALPPAAIVTLANIEYRIATHIQGAYANLLEVGNCLIEAKESELVPHGEWEAWVRRNTNMSERQAQKLMQAARNVSHGSAMERLPISKIQAILALPEPEREPMAEKASNEGMSLRELQEAVKAKQDAERELAKLKSDFHLRVDTEANKVINAAIDRVKQQSDDAVRQAQEEAERRIAEATERERKAAEVAVRKGEEINRLREQVRAAQQAAPVTGISDDAQAKIDALRDQLREAEDEAERQNELRQQAQAEMLRLQTDAARGEDGSEADRLTAADIAAAVRSFIGSLGVLPHMAGHLATLPAKDRQAIDAHIDMVADWVENARRAMQTLPGDIFIDA